MDLLIIFGGNDPDFLRTLFNLDEIPSEMVIIFDNATCQEIQEGFNKADEIASSHFD